MNKKELKIGSYICAIIGALSFLVSFYYLEKQQLANMIFWALYGLLSYIGACTLTLVKEIKL